MAVGRWEPWQPRGDRARRRGGCGSVGALAALRGPGEEAGRLCEQWEPWQPREAGTLESSGTGAVVLAGSGGVSRSVMSDSATPWTVARQALLSMGFSRREYWSGYPFPFSRDLPSQETEPRSPALQADSLPSESPGRPY